MLLAERKYYPFLRDVNNFYEKWTISTKGPSNGDVMFDHLGEFINNYNNANDMQMGSVFCSDITRTTQKRSH